MPRTAVTPTRHPDAKHPNRFWGAHPLPSRKLEFFDAVTTPASAGEGNVATIRMYGPIDSWGGFWGISAKDVGDVLDALPDSVSQIILRINSPGGEVWEATSILNMFRAHRATVTAVVDGIAASAASYLAAGCDETVMSPGTQMMIHSTSSFAFGNSAELRKVAEVLDTLNAGIIEIYTAKAGEKDWVALLEEETWMTSQEAVELGLADRIAVIPDAGETATAGVDDAEVIALPDPDDPEDSAARVIRVVARTRPHPSPSASSEPGTSNRKDDAVPYSDLKAGLRNRLGVTDAEANDETLLAALDEALAEQAETTSTIPDGTTLIDSAVLADLQSAARDGREARAQQTQERHAAIVDTAIREGRITTASRDSWLAMVAKDEATAVGVITALAANTIPVAEIGHSDQPSDDEQLYNRLFGTEQKEA